ISLGPPGADHLVRDVDLPGRVVLGSDVGAIGACPQVARLAILGAQERDMPDVLGQNGARGLASLLRLAAASELRSAAGARDVHPPAPAALGEPSDGVGVE